MKEELLHYIWKHELFEKNLTGNNGEAVKIIDAGQYNNDAGPDFVNARVIINDTIWAGNIEIHIKSSNWESHNHNKDKAYNNVILHVVSKYDKPAFRANGEQITTIELEFDEKIKQNYQELIKESNTILCHKNLADLDSFIIKMWLDSLCIERLEEKTEYINTVLKYTNNNWEETFYIILARNFGFKTNALPFELLAKSLPLKILAKYSKDILQLEALLFGQAGFLNNQLQDTYAKKLFKEYSYLKKIHKLSPIDKSLWKFMRLRPSNFPTIRISQFSNLVYKSSHLFSKTLETKNIKELTELYSCSISQYWKTHYTFDKLSTEKNKNIGKSALLGIFINTVLPFMFIYGKLRGINELKDKALELLEQIPAEKNSTIKKWEDLNIIPVNAAQSQAIILLTNNYCNKKNCLYCQIGNSIIRKTD